MMAVLSKTRPSCAGEMLFLVSMTGGGGGGNGTAGGGGIFFVIPLSWDWLT